jgi:glycosyltransferase involved in cell wall biosynthesis
MHTVQPLVSIITPTFNSSSYIKNTILSVQNQSLTDWELIIIDDCSTDNSKDIILSLAEKDTRIKYNKLDHNCGAAVARNFGIKKAQGKYIAFLDSDDIWHTDKLEIQIKKMESDNLNFTFTNYIIVNQSSDTEIKFQSNLQEVFYQDIIRFNYIACSTVIYNQETLGKHYMPEIRNRQDWGLWIKLISLAQKAICIDAYLMFYTLRADSISSNKLKMVKYHWYIYNKLLSFNYVKSALYLTRNIVLHLKNKRK